MIKTLLILFLCSSAGWGAEFLVKATGYNAGEIVTAQADYFGWGSGEVLPDFVRVQVMDMGMDEARGCVQPVYDTDGNVLYSRRFIMDRLFLESLVEWEAGYIGIDKLTFYDVVTEQR